MAGLSIAGLVFMGLSARRASTARAEAIRPLLEALYLSQIRRTGEGRPQPHQIAAAWERVVPEACFQHDDAWRPAALIPGCPLVATLFLETTRDWNSALFWTFAVSFA